MATSAVVLRRSKLRKASRREGIAKLFGLLKDSNPPPRERILEWQSQQEFPICPNPDEKDACNVYKNLQFPQEIYEHILEYHEQKADS
ncbi:MAG: hypothetical protein RM338_03915 [Nostoc sp. DedQUE12a]|nr:hypothetical protein [Nostoc sp. DedQUE12a]